MSIAAALYGFGILLQAMLLASLAGMTPLGATLLLAVAAGSALLLVTRWSRVPQAADMPLGMLTLGGFGMALGGWADLTASGAWCASGVHPLLSWMNAGMLAFGLPAMRWLPRDQNACSTLTCLLAAPWMVLGMRLGMRIAELIGSSVEIQQPVLLAYACMNVCMLLGMFVAVLPLRERPRSASATATRKPAIPRERPEVDWASI